MRMKACSATVALLLALSACSSGEPESKPGGRKSSDQPAGVERDTSVVEPAWRLDIDPVGQPEIEDGVAVVLATAAGRSLQLVAVDVATGKKLWSKPWSPGWLPNGYSVQPTTMHSKSGKAVTVFSVPPRNLRAVSEDMWRLPLVVVDLATGKELHRTDPVELLTPPVECADETDACFDLRDRKGGVRLDLDTGRLAPDPAGTPEGARGIDVGGLFATSVRPGEEIGVARQGKTLWSRPIGQVMGRTVSSDTGWSFAHDEEADRYVGWMRAALPAETRELAQAGAAFSYDIGVLRLVAFEGADGKVVWSRNGAEHTCLGIHTDKPRVRCVFTGVVTYSAKGELTEVQNGSAVLEGFDSETGKTTWSLPMANSAVGDLIDDRDQKVALGDTALVETGEGPRLVDLATGKTAAPADDEVFVCASANTVFQYAMSFFSNGDPVTRRYGGPLYRPCGADGADASAYTVAALTDSRDKPEDGRYVLSSREGLLGFESP